VLEGRLEEYMIELKNILVAIDFDDASMTALTYGRTLARTFGARLHVLHVLENSFLRAVANDPRHVESGVARRLEETLAAGDADIESVPIVRRSDSPADEVVNYARAEGIDLIVMGTHGRPGVAHFLMGSVAEKVVRTAPCPVLTVRHPEREFITRVDPAEEASSL
jgi:nucleotide-binding universal stress UspA family protein